MDNEQISKIRIHIALAVLMLLVLGLQKHEFILDSYGENEQVEEKYWPLVTTFFSNGISYIDYDMLNLALKGESRMNFENFTRLVEEYFIPANIRIVGLSVGWEEHANTKCSNITFYKWVDEFLAATDQYGIDVFFIFDPWKKTKDGHSWWSDFSTEKPELQTLLKNAQSDTNEPVLLIADSPLILEQFEEDLKQLYDYYGKHASWKGIAFRGADNATSFAPVKDLSKKIIANNYTLNNFLNSIFYLKEVILNGTHTDATECRLWQQFREDKKLLLFSSGYWQKSYPEDLIEKKIIAIVFKANISTNGFKVSWYGRRVGTPGELELELYNGDINYVSNASPIETVKTSAGLIKTQTGWQPFIEFKSGLRKGETYSIVFKINHEKDSGKYEVFHRNWKIDDSTFLVSSSSQPLRWEFKGSAIMWIRDVYDKDCMIYPFQEQGIIMNQGSDVKQVFCSPTNITFNTIFLSVSDRPYDENIATVKIIRNSDAKVIASGSINPSYTKGMYWWLPIPLESEAVLEEGEIYTLIVERMRAGIGWQLHYLITDPAVAGPQGNGRMLLFKLAYIDPVFINFMKIGPPGRAGPEAGWPGAEYRTWWAQRYNVTRTAPLIKVEINIEKYGTPGDLIVRLKEDDGTGLAPAKEDIEMVRIPAADIPTGRIWLNITGWNATLTAGKLYWIVLSTDKAPDGNGYWPWKIEYAYQFLIKRSDDAGVSWVRPHEPAELYIYLFTGEETFIVEPEEIVRETFITDKRQVAQSFSLNNDTYANGILIFLSRGLSDKNGFLTVEIRPDDGFDSPSTMVLTSGKIRMVENGVTYKGMYLVEFEYPYFLKAGVKYWLVIKGDSFSRIEPVVFTFHHPEFSYGGTQLKVKITNDGGQNWYLPEGKEGDLIFGIVKSPYSRHFFTAQELIADIETYHIHDLYEEPMHGLNAYLNVQISNLQKKLVQWFKSYTKREWLSLDFNHPNIVEENQGWQELFSIVKVNDISNISEIITEFSKAMIIPELDVAEGNLSAVEKYYRATLSKYPWPFTLFKLRDIRLLETMMNTTIASFWNVLKLMRYISGPYGRSKDAVRVLLIGDKNMQVLAQYLLSTVNITLAKIDMDQNFTRFGDFKTYDVIVLALDEYSARQFTQDAQQRIKEFVRRGGGFVVMFNWPEWVDEIVGFSSTSEKVSPGQISYADLKHSILVTYTSIDWYIACWNVHKIIQISENVSFIVRDSNSQPWISSNPYGSGLGILCGAPSNNITELKYDYLTTLTNAIFYAAKKDYMLPTVWYGDSLKEKSLGDHTEYTISGKLGGPLLLWLTSNNNETRFEINLNANFFNIDTDGWVALDAVSWLPVGMGNSTEICIKIQSGTWLPIYIMNDTQDFHILYSNLLIKAQKIYPNQALYEICSDLEQDVWLIVRSTAAPREIRVGANFIRSVSELSTLYKPIEGSYFYDEKNRLIYIRFIAKEKDTVLRIIYEETRSIFYMVDENKRLIYVLLVLSLVLVELYALNRAKSRAGGE